MSTSTHVRLWKCGVFLLTLAGCGETMPADGGTDAERPEPCASAAACDDGLFCTGEETCAPGATGAGPDGCVAGTPPCASPGDCAEPDEVCRDCGDPDMDGDGEDRLECGGSDCDDEDATVFVGATEVCDSVDQDCDPETLGERDADGDERDSIACCNPDGAAMECGPDCEDDNPAVGLLFEICDTRDNDCDGVVDEDSAAVDWYPDEDGDGFGDPTGTAVSSCIPVSDHSFLDTDCDDDNAAVHRGVVEACNGRDDDCDEAVDEDLTGCVVMDGGGGDLDAGALDAGVSDAGVDACVGTICGGACVDTSSDELRCGDCVTICAGAEVCVSGDCVVSRLLAVHPSIAVTGQRVRVHGDFAPGAVALRFPGTSSDTTATRLGDHVVEAVVPSGAGIGRLTLGGGGGAGLRFRRATFGLGVGKFRRAYEQTTYARAWPVLGTARAEAASWSSRAWLYVFGGTNGATALDTIERALVNVDGTVAEPTSAGRLVTPRQGAAAIQVGDFVYVIGGVGEASVERAPVGVDGALGAFDDAGVSLRAARAGHSALLIGRWVYVVGGGATTVERAEVAADGSLSAFTVVPGVSTSVVRRRAAAAIVGQHMFLFGGTSDGATPLPTVERAPISGDGALGAFVSGGIMRAARAGARAIVLSPSSESMQRVFLVGGRASGGVTERAVVDVSTGDATFTDGVSSLQTERRAFAAEQIGNHLYIIGGDTAGGPVATWERATINATGNLAPGVLFGGTTVPGAGSGQMFAIGPRVYWGQGGTYTNGPLSSASVAEDGSMGAFEAAALGATWHAWGAGAVAAGRVWNFGSHFPNSCTAAPSAAYFTYDAGGAFTAVSYTPLLAVAQCYQAAAILGDHVYSFTGIGGTCSDFGRRDSVQRSPVASPSWSTVGNVAFSVQLPSTLVVDDTVYLVGGDTSAAERRIQQATLSGGSLGAFTVATPQLALGGATTLAVVGDRVYTIGGTGVNRADQCARADLPLAADFTTALADCLATPRGNAGVLEIGNWLYVVGGYDYVGGASVATVERLELQ